MASEAERIPIPLDLLWVTDSVASPTVRSGDSSEVGERLSLNEAIALALDANRLAKNPARRRLIAESVQQTYAGALRAQRALDVREKALQMCRELERVMDDRAKRGEATQSVVLEARAALALATTDVLNATQEFMAWARQLNNLMGRDLQARLRVSPELGTTAAAIPADVTASGPDPLTEVRP